MSRIETRMNRLKLKYVLIFAMLFFTTVALAIMTNFWPSQQAIESACQTPAPLPRIAGNVIDDERNQPISEAEITIQGILREDSPCPGYDASYEIQLTTDANGYFEFGVMSDETQQAGMTIKSTRCQPNESHDFSIPIYRDGRQSVYLRCNVGDSD